jgi:hypothetical protein
MERATPPPCQYAHVPKAPLAPSHCTRQGDMYGSQTIPLRHKAGRHVRITNHTSASRHFRARTLAGVSLVSICRYFTMPTSAGSLDAGTGTAVPPAAAPAPAPAPAVVPTPPAPSLGAADALSSAATLATAAAAAAATVPSASHTLPPRFRERTAVTPPPAAMGTTSPPSVLSKTQARAQNQARRWRGEEDIHRRWGF